MQLIKPSYQILSLPNTDQILLFLETCGRVAYKSEDRIGLGTAKKFIRSIVGNQHLSVIEHVSMTVRFICDRGVTHELVRHRLCSFTQESTRYCNYSKDKHGNQLTFIIPPWYQDILAPGEYDMVPDNLDEVAENWFIAMYRAEEHYLNSLALGESPQQARSILPNALKTEIIVTANLREWRHIFAMRCASGAHPQMAEIMVPLRDEMVALLPEIFNV